jgi:hypothetical protein
MKINRWLQQIQGDTNAIDCYNTYASIVGLPINLNSTSDISIYQLFTKYTLKQLFKVPVIEITRYETVEGYTGMFNDKVLKYLVNELPKDNVNISILLSYIVKEL